jgi:hypothetical protein
MTAWLVHDSEPEPQWTALVVALDEFVDRCGIGQRRQPHSVCANLTRRQLVEHDLAKHSLFRLDCHQFTTVSKIGAAVNL